MMILHITCNINTTLFWVVIQCKTVNPSLINLSINLSNFFRKFCVYSLRDPLHQSLSSFSEKVSAIGKINKKSYRKNYRSENNF